MLLKNRKKQNFEPHPGWPQHIEWSGLVWSNCKYSTLALQARVKTFKGLSRTMKKRAEGFLRAPPQRCTLKTLRRRLQFAGPESGALFCRATSPRVPSVLIGWRREQGRGKAKGKAGKLSSSSKTPLNPDPDFAAEHRA